MLFVISKDHEIPELFFVKAPTSELAHKMVGVADNLKKCVVLSDEQVKVLVNTDVCLIREK